MIDDADRSWVEGMSDAYDQWLVPTVFHPFAVDLAGRVAGHAPHRVLEVAAGTGALTTELVRAVRSADVVATDFNVSMVELGRRRVPEARWRQADAMELPFADAEFDIVASQFGAMFFPDKQTAFREALRVLRPEGSYLISTWAELEAHDFEAALVRALHGLFPDDPPTFIADVPHGYADPDVVTKDLRAAGFAVVTVERVTVEGRARSVAELMAGYCRGTPLRSALDARGDLDELQSAITAEMVRALGSDGEVVGRMAALVFEATG